MGRHGRQRDVYRNCRAMVSYKSLENVETLRRQHSVEVNKYASNKFPCTGMWTQIFRHYVWVSNVLSHLDHFHFWHNQFADASNLSTSSVMNQYVLLCKYIANTKDFNCYVMALKKQYIILSQVKLFMWTWSNHIFLLIST